MKYFNLKIFKFEFVSIGTPSIAQAVSLLFNLSVLLERCADPNHFCPVFIDKNQFQIS